MARGWLWILLVLPLVARAQDDKPLLSISGIIYEAQSVQVLPYATVAVKGTNNGTISAANGFFSIVAGVGDTLLISTVGYKRMLVPVPDTLERSRVTIMIPMEVDTVLLEEAVVYPWPSREQFRQEFLALQTTDPFELKMMPIPGIRAIPNPIPIEPNWFWNPASFLHEKVFQEVLDRLPKKKRAAELPRFD